MGTLIYSFIIYPLTQIIELVFSFGNKIFGNTGISILGVSFAVSLLTLPLYIIAEHWQQIERDTQKRMKPWITHIKSTFKGDEQYMILSTYYRLNHYHPIMSLRSAFGLLIQIPFFTAAYSCLSNMTALQGEHFLFIRDMGSPDALFSIGSFNVNILPIAMTLINMVSGFLYTRGLSLRDKIQTYGLALLFVVILYNSPAGLVMYWTMNNIFSLVKNIFYKMKHPVKTLYCIACVLVTLFIAFLLFGHVLSFKRAILVSFVFALVYFAPIFVRLANYLIEKPFKPILENRKQRFVLFLTSSLSLFLLSGLLIPVLLVASSTMEFSGIDDYGSPLYFIKNTCMQAFGLFVVWPSLIYFLYREKMQTLISFSFAILLVSSLVNAFCFQGNYGTLSTLLVFTNVSSVDSSLFSIAVNMLAIFALFAIIIAIIAIKKSVILNYFFAVIAVSLIFVSAFQIKTIKKDYKNYERLSLNGDANSKPSPIFHLSKTGKNVVILYLDRAQNRFVEPIFEESPELYDIFQGFTLFKNTVSFNGHTLIGAAPVFGGYEYTPESMNKRNSEKLVDKQNEALTVLPRIFTEQAKDFSAVVTDPAWANYSWIPDLTIFKDYPAIQAYNTDKKYLSAWYKEHEGIFDANITSTVLKRNILWYSVFRTSPLALRPAFYNDGKYWSPNTNLADVNGFLEGYSALDYLPELTDFNSKTENVFINFINNTTHEEMFLQAPEFVPVTTVTNRGKSKFKDNALYHSNAASLKRVGDWLNYLKENGVYDNTRIVIVADHGAVDKENEYNWDENFDRIGPGHFHPLFMFKDFNSTGNLLINSDFMTNADTSTLLLSGFVDSPKNPYTGKDFNNSEKEKGALICMDDIFMPYHNKSDYIFTAKNGSWIRVKGNIFNSDNWKSEAAPIGEN
ncbi:MAG: YidC/Oxa1 family membrane protein insertase [Treponema sp.]|uniref:YidC/Oxa1 family membrane protein insertase n=1 Tax=Treponema sp. TaxID=166 RepID=UPI0025FCCD9B|nr:YidC/Oxa1 family membrane protein insertase [Treponema sp.]MBQ8679107.1 YidC/Oxa1 family membrane protein insertase [Treponema sp.]